MKLSTKVGIGAGFLFLLPGFTVLTVLTTAAAAYIYVQEA